jgi:hypothetical protein
MASLKSKSRKKRRRIPIDRLLDYWVDLSKRQTLTVEDFVTFANMCGQTLDYFFDYYGWYRSKHLELHKDKFYRDVLGLCTYQDDVLKKLSEHAKLPNHYYAQMKDYAKKFITRIKKHFGQDLMQSRATRAPLQDAEDLVSYSSKLTYREAAGIVASNHIVRLLMRLSKLKQGDKVKDDITTLHANLIKNTTNARLKRFLQKSYRRFEDADKTRNRCAHPNEGDPTPQEIEQSIALGRLLQRYVR